MHWLVLSLLCAFFVALSDLFAKMSRLECSPAFLAAARSVLSAPFLLILIPFLKMPRDPFVFWGTMAISLPFEIIAAILYFRAIRLAPMSLTLPHLSFTPVLVIVTGWLMMGEKVNTTGGLGILVVFIGAYILHLGNGKGFFAPLMSLAREPGARIMLSVAAIWSLTAVFSKKMVLASDALTFAFIYSVAIIAGMLVSSYFLDQKQLKRALKPDKYMILAGVFIGLSTVFHALAIQYVLVAYFIAVKRTSMIFGVLFGWWILKETKGPQRLIASIIMVFGIAIIVLST